MKRLFTGIVHITLESKCHGLAIINKPSCSDLKAHFMYVIIVGLCSRIGVLTRSGKACINGNTEKLTQLTYYHA